ncbi:MAG TPA: phosphoribosylamine--glycine ligase [Bryobacteraceae bacterium]|nr:phosphoribosylamine--glycine ligase [Bryobacteraceae bacterium]
MRILVIGGGGREHALCWKLAQSEDVEILASPGNPGMAQIGKCLPLEQAERLRPDLTVVGPEVPLVDGVVDRFRAKGLAIVGPTRDAARLEGSKAFAKSFMQNHGIPTADFVTVDNVEDAKKALDRFGFPVVLKADGLAAGKGVVIAASRVEAEHALSAGGVLAGRVVVEEYLQGEEISFIALCDGRDVVPLQPSQDHKAVFDGDQGPNTGGMGAYCDGALLTDAQTHEILTKTIYPTVEATKFSGFLYAGMMMTADGPKVLEFNVRLGDPETQPLMHRMESEFVPSLWAAATGKLNGVRLSWKAAPSVCVVIASGGYPGEFAAGKAIHGIEAAEAEGVTVFQAGTRIGPEGLETSGGRVLGVTASGQDLGAAIKRAYAGVAKIRFEGMHFRKDIGMRGRK